MNTKKLDEMILKLAKFSIDNEKFSIDVLAQKAKQASQTYPTDITLVAISNFLSKRASTKTVWITRAELRDVYNKLYTNNNKFATLFPTELGIKEQYTPKTMVRDPNEGKDLISEAYNKLADPILSNALSNIFDKKSTILKLYSNDTAKSAQKSCAFELNREGVSPKKIDVVAGQSDLLICQAFYDTPKGEAYVLVPIEIKDNKALLPTMFVSSAGFEDLKSTLIKDHLLKTAGKKYQIDVQKLLNTVSSVKNGSEISTISDVERIVIKASLSKETPYTHLSNNIIAQEIDPVREDVKEPTYELPTELKTISEKLTSSSGTAEFIFGKETVNSSRNLVRQMLSNFGYKKAQVAVADNNKNTIFYAVSVDNGAGFKIPVNIDNGKIQEPAIILSSGGIEEFSSNGISKLLAEGGSDYKMSLVASPMYDLKPAELVHYLKVALHYNRLTQAEEILSLLKESNDNKAFRVGYELYTQGLSELSTDITKKASSIKQQCSKQYKTANSKYIICGHTNMPIHKIYQDKNGDCQPLYRKSMDETSSSTEGAFFNSTRVLLG